MPRVGRSPTSADASLGNKDIQLRVRLTGPESEKLNAAAAHLGHQNVSRFVRWALMQAAEQVLARPGVVEAQRQAQAVAQRAMALQAPPAPPQRTVTPPQSLAALLGVPLYGGAPADVQALGAVDGDDWV